LRVSLFIILPLTHLKADYIFMLINFYLNNIHPTTKSNFNFPKRSQPLSETI